MEIGPTLRAMAQNKVKVGLLVAEVAFTLAIVLNCLGMLLEQRSLLTRSTGIDEDRLIAVTSRPWGAEFSDREHRRQAMDRDVAALRAMPGVERATPISNFPLQGGGSSFQLRPMDAPDSALVRSPVYYSDESFIDTLGLELVAGRAFTPDDVPVERGPLISKVIITQALADAMYPDGDALGKTVYTGSEEYPDVIIGIVAEMYTPYGGGPMEDRITFYPGKPAGASRSRYLVRAADGAYGDVQKGLEEQLLAIDSDRVVQIESMTEVKGRGFALARFLVTILTVIIALLLFVTALGLFGVTSFAVAQRTRQIGTRRALGGARWQIVRYFLVETTLIAALGIALGLIAAYGLNLALVSSGAGTPLSPGLVVAGIAILWSIGLVATIIPALKASRIPPALATQSA